MTVMAHEPLSQEDILQEGFLALRTPEGFRAELIEGEIVVTPPPNGDHENCVNLILKQVMRRSATDLDFSGHKGLKITSVSGSVHRVIPDGTWALAEQDLFPGAEPWMSVDGVVMVAEVTSRRADRDREAKRRCYAQGLVPVYLLVDRDRSTVTIFSQPEDGDYIQARRYPFGKEVPLPEPFSFDLDTSRFT